MGRAVVRIGDYCTGHDSCPPTPLITGSGNVKINGKPAGLIGDQFASHGCSEHSEHTPVIVVGTSRVKINGKGVGLVGDPVSCGGNIRDGSGNVFINE